VKPPDWTAATTSSYRAGSTTTATLGWFFAAQAFVHTATYDVAVASWMGNVVSPTDGGSGFPAWIGATWDRSAVLRYGENPHQRAALYTNGHLPGGLATAEQLHGKEMSYNNYVDADAAWRAAHDHAEPAVAIIKHANPCGIAVGAQIAEAHAKAHACDPVSAFGGVIAANRTVTAAMAAQVVEVFTEVVVAPDFEPEALEILTQKKNLRLLRVSGAPAGGVELRPISGGLLLQQRDAIDAVVEGGGDDPASVRALHGQAARVHAVDLSHADAHRGAARGEEDRVRLHGAHRAPREGEVSESLGVGGLARREGPRGGVVPSALDHRVDRVALLQE
jgi:AICAR transformylase/IMP cyclohydrolase PurH